MKSIFSKILSPVFAATIFFLFGIIIGVLVRDFPVISLKKEASIGELANFILAVVIAIFIPFFLNRKINNKRAEKDILIEEWKKLQDEVQELRELVESIHSNPSRIKKELADRMVLKTRHLSKTLSLLKESTKPYLKHKELKLTMSALENTQKTLDKSLTNKLRDKTPRITKKGYLDTESSLYKYLSDITKLVMCINDI